MVTIAAQAPTTRMGRLNTGRLGTDSLIGAGYRPAIRSGDRPTKEGARVATLAVVVSGGKAPTVWTSARRAFM